MKEEIQYFGGTGRAKEAVARVSLSQGEGTIIINKGTMENYFGGRALIFEPFIKQPLVATSTLGKYNVLITIRGGGIVAQTKAIKHGIARALLKANSELHPILRKGGYLTRDSRTHERKKYGLYGRRRRFQFSKR